MEILLVDDDTQSESRLYQLLQQSKGAPPLHTSPNAVAALELIRSLNQNKAAKMPRIVLLNLDLSRQDGLEFLRQLRTIEDLPAISVYIFTRDRDNALLPILYQHHVAGYILQPYARAEFAQKVSTLIRYWEICEF